MNYIKETEDINLAYKVRHALNENLDALPPEITNRLNSARNAALSRKKSDAPLRVFNIRSVLTGNVANIANRHFFG